MDKKVFPIEGRDLNPSEIKKAVEERIELVAEIKEYLETTADIEIVRNFKNAVDCLKEDQQVSIFAYKGIDSLPCHKNTAFIDEFEVPEINVND